MQLNFDSDNAYPSSERTFHQALPGPTGGVTVEAELSLEDSPWLDDDRADVFRVYADATPYEILQSPSGAPSREETFVGVKPEFQQQVDNCTPHNQLSLNSDAHYYDAESYACLNL